MPLVRLLSTLWIPHLLLGALLYLRDHPDLIPGGFVPLLPTMPYVLAGVGALLGARFHQSRAVFALVVLVLAYPAIVAGGVLAGAALVLAPVNLAFIAFWSEKGVLSAAGLFRVGMLVAQATGIAWIAFGDSAARDAQTLLDHQFVDFGGGRGGLSQSALVALAVGYVILVVRAVRGGSPLDGGFAGCVLALALAADGDAVPLVMGAGTLIVGVAVVQESYRLAYMDELTGLPGRRALMTAMGKLGGRYCVAMLDVDHFKKFNDTYGHDVGDQVLQMVATRVGRVGGGGTGYRYGGEEFTVLFPGRDTESALEYLEALREDIADAGFKLRGKDRPKGKPATKEKAGASKTVSVTVSIGGADADSAGDPVAALKVADDKLYKAKKAGRNRVAI